MEQKKHGSLAQGLISVVAILAIAIAAVVGVSILAGQNPGFIFSEILNRLQSQTPDGTSQSSGESNNPEILGVYCFFVEGGASDGDATVIDQWWAYSFENGGTFRTFLEGAEQFGGTWNSSGLELNLTSNAMEDFESFEYVGTISSDGQSITIGELELFRSDVVCTSENQPAQ